jgi:hypothetical protein
MIKKLNEIDIFFDDPLYKAAVAKIILLKLNEVIDEVNKMSNKQDDEARNKRIAQAEQLRQRQRVNRVEWSNQDQQITNQDWTRHDT